MNTGKYMEALALYEECLLIKEKVKGAISIEDA
jgi:hypothetical protein